MLISAVLFPTSVPGQALLAALDAGVLLISVDLLHELRTVLARPRFARYVTRDERDRFLVALERDAELVDLTIHVVACRDPKDDHLLSLAVSGRASHLISGDEDLLALHPYQGIAIRAPRDFLNTMGAGSKGNQTVVGPDGDTANGSGTESA